MQEVYAALMLHDAKQPINEDNLKKVLSSVGASVEDTKIKALVASLEGVDIDQALTQAAVAAVAAPVASGAAEKAAPVEDDGKKAEEAAAGLSALFG
jgi:large subunit ribosomal protein L12